MSKTLRLTLDPMMLRTPVISPLFRLASRASAVARLIVDRPLPDIRPGWYLFEAEFAADEDIPTQLVVDYGEGFAWLERLAPRVPDQVHGHAGRLRSVVTIKREPRDLGLLAGPKGRLPSLQTATLRPIGRLRAWLEMLRGILALAPDHRLATTSSALGRFARTFVQHGRRAAADELVERYESHRRGITNDYGTWLAATSERTLPAAATAPRSLDGSAPDFSLLMVLDRNQAAHSMRSVNSVLAQTWPGWQLCICHDQSEASSLPPELAGIAAGDRRIVLVPIDSSDTADGWTAALTAAEGRYCGRLPSGDRLAPHALHAMLEALQQQPSAGFLYSDHDSIDATGRRSSPSFKPDWSPDLACQRDVLLHLALIERSVLLALGHDAGGDAYDVALRACDALSPECIVHVPQVLYHRLQRAPEAGQDIRAVTALDAHLTRIGQAGEVHAVATGMYRVVYPLPEVEPSVEVLLPTRDQRKLLARCVEGVLERTDYRNLRVRIIDNDSRDPDVLRLLDTLSQDPRVTVERAPGAFNFSRIMNRAARRAQAQVLCLLNDDVLPTDPGWLREMVSHALRPDIGAVGAFLRFPDGSVQHAGVVTGIGGVAAHVHYRMQREAIASCPDLATVRNYTALTAACMVVTRHKFEQVGGLDELLPVCYNDVDFCLRLRAEGYFNAWTPFASLSHHESATRGPDDTPLKRARHQREFARMLTRWGDRLNRDPAYNPNLSLYGEPFDLAHAPRLTNQFHPAYPVHVDQSPFTQAAPLTQH